MAQSKEKEHELGGNASQIHWIAMLNVDNEYYVLASNDGRGIDAFKSEEDARGYFEKAYLSAKARGQRGAASAMFSHISLKPRVLGISEDDISSKLFDLEKGVQPVRMSAPFGRVTGLKCNRPLEIVASTYQSGIAPSLKGEYDC